MTENLERHQEKLEEKQAACLEQIQEMEKQVGVEGVDHYPCPQQSWPGSRVQRDWALESCQSGGGRRGIGPSPGGGGVRALVPRGS